MQYNLRSCNYRQRNNTAFMEIKKMKTLIKLSHILPTDEVQAFDALQQYNLFDYMDVGLTADSDNRIQSVYNSPEEAIKAFFEDYQRMTAVPLPVRAEFIKPDGSRESKVVRSFYHLMRLCSLLSNDTLKKQCRKYMLKKFHKA